MRAIALVCVIALVAGCVEPQPETVLVPKGLDYLASMQNADGGFPAGDNGSSDYSTSAWVALALGSASPEHSSIPALRRYLNAHSSNVSSNQTGSFSRVNPVSLYVLADEAIGLEAADEHVGRLRGLVDNTSLAANEQIFVLGALARAGETEAAGPLYDRMMAKILDPADPDIGNDSWMRSHAILAVLAAGAQPDSADMKAAARSLLPFQKEEKGFRGQMEYEPDASSTSAVVAVLSQIRFVYSSEQAAGRQFLLELQEPSGAVRFSEEFDFSPVKTTAEAILAGTGDGPFRD